MSATPASVLLYLVALAAAPLFVGVVNRTKAWCAGRRGAPLVQPYRDLLRLSRRGTVYSQTSTWVLPAAPVVNLATLAGAMLMVPLGGIPAPLGFPGDLVVVAALLALGRFLTVLAALDTGSSFEGMGASREAHFATLAEPALFAALAVLVHLSGSTSLSAAIGASGPALWARALPALALVAAALAVLLVVENSRIPIDDPTTHLELTMVHEVMVLDHGGPDLALIQYAASLKLWLGAALLAGVLVPVRGDSTPASAVAMLAAMALLAIALGLVESAMARLKLTRVPQLLVAALALAAVAFVISLG